MSYNEAAFLHNLYCGVVIAGCLFLLFAWSLAFVPINGVILLAYLIGYPYAVYRSFHAVKREYR